MTLIIFRLEPIQEDACTRVLFQRLLDKGVLFKGDRAHPMVLS